MVLSQGAHLDWDWLNPFLYNVNETQPCYVCGYFGPSSCPAGTTGKLLIRTKL
jgi:hypothetical protein